MNLSALELTNQLFAIATALGATELLLLQRDWSDKTTGIWRWSQVREDYAFLPSSLRLFLDPLLVERGFRQIQIVRIVLAIGLVVFSSQPILIGFQILLLWLTSFRFRGTLNGGSDAMTMVVAIGLFIGTLSPDSILLKKLGLAYIAIQLTASYFLAGIAKLKSHEWRNGTALSRFIEIPGYDRVPGALRTCLALPRRARMLGYGVIAFECLFPIVWLRPEATVPFLGCAVLFHLLNFAAFGLNRFVFAWLAAYPALLYWVGLLP